MRVADVFVFSIVLVATPALAQRPSDPALLVPQNAPALEFVPVPDPLKLPADTKLGASASVAFNSKGHLIVLYRGLQPLAEFDANGTFIRSFGEDLFTRTHGLRIDADDNIWVTDVTSHIVVKLSPQGQVLLTLGVKGQAGDWNEATQSRFLNEPTDVAIGPNGDIFVAQGHTPAGGDPRVLKFDKTGRFLKTWGGKGTEPGKFVLAHGVALDAKGLVWVADRENQRIQVFDTDGAFVREMKYAGLPCGIHIGQDAVYMVNGFAGQILKLSLDGQVLAATGKAGKGLGEFGEAHYVTVSPKGELYVADTVNGAVQKFVKK
jgi:DNA-binding beta-propeller fold protein YncE